MDESGDEVQDADVPVGNAAAPFFETKLKHYKIFEGMPVTFTCRVAGNPQPKVSKNHHHSSSTAIREKAREEEEILWLHLCFIRNNQITENV